MMRKQFPALLLLVACLGVQGCFLLPGDPTIEVEGELLDYYTGKTINRSVRILVNGFESPVDRSGGYAPITSFTSSPLGDFSYSFRDRENLHYSLFIPPTDRYGVSEPSYAPLKKRGLNYVIFRLKPVRPLIFVTIGCEQNFPHGIRISNLVTTPFPEEVRKIADVSFLMTGRDTSFYLPAVPEEPHRVTASGWFVDQDTIISWSHIVDVGMDTVRVDFMF